MDVSSANVAAARIATAEALRVVAAALDACADAGDWKEFAGDAVRSVIADAFSLGSANLSATSLPRSLSYVAVIASLVKCASTRTTARETALRGTCRC